jgi:hypothetical protein
VRPATMVQDVREVAMEREDEVHSELGIMARTAGSRSRYAAYWQLELVATG